MEPSHLRGSAAAHLPRRAAPGRYVRIRQCIQRGAPVRRNFFWADWNAHAHVTLGVVYLGVIALRRKFIPILLALWLVAWLATPAYSPFHYGAHVLLIAALVCSLIMWLKPKIYDAADVEVAGLYWHFVDLVWMFIFPLVYIMSTKIV